MRSRVCVVSLIPFSSCAPLCFAVLSMLHFSVQSDVGEQRDRRGCGAFGGRSTARKSVAQRSQALRSGHGALLEVSCDERPTRCSEVRA